MKTLFVFLFIYLAGISVTNACKCRDLGFDREVEQADEIFTGQVIGKTVSDKVYYLFKVSQAFKGRLTDTLTISTGFGGGDCGMAFEAGKSYLVYATGRYTTSCRRNAPIAQNPDTEKLKYRFGLTRDVGTSNASLLTAGEAAYFNAELTAVRNGFDFQNKKLGFYYRDAPRSKREFFRHWGGKEGGHQLVLLSATEAKKSGLDALLVTGFNGVIDKHKRKRIVARFYP